MRYIPVKTIIFLLVVAGVGYGYAQMRERNRQPPNYRHAEVTTGPVVAVVNATGTVQPVLSVSVGAFVSGPIQRVLVDFNAVVKKDELLAEIDPRLFKAAKAQAEAQLATKKAEEDRAKALLDQAKNDEGRAQLLQKENKNFISAAEMDQFKFNRIALDAQLIVAKAAVQQAEASLETAKANLNYTEIRSPVDGIVINRKIDPGQTLASQFQTPELFVVAPDMKTKMHILAAVDEADIGLIKEAQRRGLPVRFTVDAYPDDLFEGQIFQVRMSSTTTQNVVTYPVVVATPNPDLKLMPGMTASLSFQVDEVKSTLRVPNAALRFFPKRELVRPEDRKLLEGANDTADSSEESAGKLSASEKAQSRKNRNRRHVWIEDGLLLRAVPVVVGISDNRQHTQLVSGEIVEGQKLVTGIRAVQ